MTTDDALRSSPAFRALMEAIVEYVDTFIDHAAVEAIKDDHRASGAAHEKLTDAAFALAREQRSPVEPHVHEWVSPTSTNALAFTVCGRCGDPYDIKPALPTLPAADAAREAVLLAIYDFEEIDAKACGTATIFCEHWRTNARTQLDAYAAAITRPLETRVRELERVLRKRTEEIHAEYDDADDIWTCASERCIESCATLTANSEAQDE